MKYTVIRKLYRILAIENMREKVSIIETGRWRKAIKLLFNILHGELVCMLWVRMSGIKITADKLHNIIIL